MLSLILDARLQKNGSPLGAVNAALYHLAQVAPETFNDITVGDNSCTALGHGRVYNCCPDGFEATKGWDPVTGLGSVDFKKLKEGLVGLVRRKK
jgi:tripeptidyl-peptidase-1